MFQFAKFWLCALVLLGNFLHGFGIEKSIHYVKVFSENANEGNLAGVVPLALGLEAAQMQAIAENVGASETVFIT